MLFSLLLVAAAAFPPLAPAAFPAQEAAPSVQETSTPSAIDVLNQAQRAAKESGQTLFVYLEAPW